MPSPEDFEAGVTTILDCWQAYVEKQPGAVSDPAELELRERRYEKLFSDVAKLANTHSQGDVNAMHREAERRLNALEDGDA